MIESALNGYLSAVAKRNAAAEPENTEASRGLFNPKAAVIANAKTNSKSPLRTAAIRVKRPRIRAAPRAISVQVASQAIVGMIGCGTDQFSLAVYAMKRPKSPQATCGAP